MLAKLKSKSETETGVIVLIFELPPRNYLGLASWSEGPTSKKKFRRRFPVDATFFRLEITQLFLVWEPPTSLHCLDTNIIGHHN